MRILCTHPGRYGDILWALPTARALALAYDQPVDVLTSAKYEAITRLIEQQPYIEWAGFDRGWEVQETAPISPREPTLPTGEYDRVFHLGYIGWPGPTLAEDMYARAASRCALPPLDLDTPWIAPPSVTVAPSARPLVWVGWSEEYFELKVGLLVCLAARFPSVLFRWLRPWAGRYDEVDKVQRPSDLGEADEGQPQHRLGINVSMVRANWPMTATLAQQAHVYLGCLSSAWVLANALGKPTVIVEPNPQRHHPVFWLERERNHLVLGGDGKPTFDARHTGDILEGVLNAC